MKHEMSATSTELTLALTLAADLSKLPVAPLVGRPPVPVVKPLAVLLLLALSPARPEHPPLPEVTGPPGVGLIALVVRGQGVPGQAPALRLQCVHRPQQPVNIAQNRRR